jgi:release factor glutamine methyltransferase
LGTQLNRTVAALLAGCGLPALEGRALLAYVLGVPREQLIAHPDTPVGAETEQRFGALVARCKAGEPLAYLLGAKEFYGRTFLVTADVLVPRPETESLVDAALECLEGFAAPQVLELGTGSGCIAITLVLERPVVILTATDVSAAALEVAQANASSLGARGPGVSVRWLLSDWYGAVDLATKFDLIVSNPPYVAANDPHLNALRHEPRIALTAGADGLACLREICSCATSHLAEGGWIALEHGYDQAAAVRGLLTAAGFREISSHRDAAGVERVTRARR